MSPTGLGLGVALGALLGSSVSADCAGALAGSGMLVSVGSGALHPTIINIIARATSISFFLGIDPSLKCWSLVCPHYSLGQYSPTSSPKTQKGYSRAAVVSDGFLLVEIAPLLSPVVISSSLANESAGAGQAILLREAPCRKRPPQVCLERMLLMVGSSTC